VAKLVLAAPGALAGVPLMIRLAALAVAVTIVLASRRVMLAVLAGEAVLIGGALWLA